MPGKVKLATWASRYDADSLWFNLKPGAFAGDPRAAWLQRDELRQAISHRRGPEGLRRHGVPRRRRAGLRPGDARRTRSGTGRTRRRRRTTRPRAKQLLASIGLTDRNGDGMLEDAAGRPARFTLLTQKGRPNARTRRGGHPRRAEEDRRDGGRRRARGRRGRSSVSSDAQVRRGLFHASSADRHRSGASTRTSGSAPAARTSGTSRRRRRRPSGRRRIDELMARQIATRRRSRAQAAVRSGAGDFRRAPADACISPRRASSWPRRRASINADAWRSVAAAAAVGAGRGRASSPLMAATSSRRLAFALCSSSWCRPASLVLARLAPGDYVTTSLGLEAQRAKRWSRRARGWASTLASSSQYRRLARRGGPAGFRALAALRPAGRAS